MPNNQLKAQLEQERRDQHQRSRRELITIGAVVGVILVIVAIFSVIFLRATKPPAGPYDKLSQTTADGGFPILGDPRTSFVIAEVTDFNCTACSALSTLDPQIIDDFVRNGRARFVWVLTGTSANASLIDQVALCANFQNKFWEVHDALFRYQAQIPTSQQSANAFSLGALQQAIAPTGVDQNKIAACVAGGTVQTIIQAGQNFQRTNKVTDLPTLLWSTQPGKWQRFVDNRGQPYPAGSIPVEMIGNPIENYYSPPTVTPTLSP